MVLPVLAVMKKARRLRIRRVPMLRGMKIPAMPTTRVSTLIKRGVTRALAREIKKYGHPLAIQARLMSADPNLTRDDMIFLENRARQGLEAGESLQFNVQRDAGANQPVITFDNEGNYISDQGGRYSIDTDIIITNPDTGVSLPAEHTFITVDRPTVEEMAIMIGDFVAGLQNYPRFAAAFAEGRFGFDYDITNVEMVE
jgi:hypothetical protein